MRKKNPIQETELRYRTLFEQSPDGVVLLDTDGNMLEFNDAAHLQLGYTKDEFKKLRLCDIDAAETPEDIQARINYLLKAGTGEFEVRHRAKNGAIRDVQIITQKLVFSGQTVFHAIWRDITERKKAEEELRDSREFIKSILNTVDEGFIVIDRDYRIISANKAYCNLVNMPLGNIIGRHCHEISHRSDKRCYEFGENCAVRDSFEKSEPFVYSHKHYDTDGNVSYVETKSYPLKDVSGNVTSVIEIVNNITDKHLLEEQLLRTQKLEAVGLLAGGLAHDFNNLLQGIFGSISLAKMFSDSAGKAYQMLEGAEIALNQARNLTKQLLTFSKGGEPVKKIISLSSVIQDSVKFSLSGSNVNYQFSMDENLWPVDADEGQISQVIHNIVLNASDAMPVDGTVRIKATNVLIDRKNISPLKKGKYVLLAIEDSGIGIPVNYLNKIFDPYFTTKKKGSGLGLATTFSIIKKHGGMIDVKSEPGKGSTFFIYLPASNTKLPSKKEKEESIVTGKGRVLVMDDEEIVTLVVGQMLKSLGYEADFAENGEEAVEKYAAAMKSGEAFDTVILDLTVRGGMGGKETVNRLRGIDPAVTAIVSSGYSDDPVVANYRDYGFKDILSKPYEIGRLGSVLYALINPESPP